MDGSGAGMGHLMVVEIWGVLAAHVICCPLSDLTWRSTCITRTKVSPHGWPDKRGRWVEGEHQVTLHKDNEWHGAVDLSLHHCQTSNTCSTSIYTGPHMYIPLINCRLQSNMHVLYSSTCVLATVNITFGNAGVTSPGSPRASPEQWSVHVVSQARGGPASQGVAGHPAPGPA